jgi:hypothetical protein
MLPQGTRAKRSRLMRSHYFFARSNAIPTDDTSTSPDQVAMFSCDRAMCDPVLGTPSVGGPKLAFNHLRPLYAARDCMIRDMRPTEQGKFPQKTSVRIG